MVHIGALSTRLHEILILPYIALTAFLAVACSLRCIGVERVTLK